MALEYAAHRHCPNPRLRGRLTGARRGSCWEAAFSGVARRGAKGGPSAAGSVPPTPGTERRCNGASRRVKGVVADLHADRRGLQARNRGHNPESEAHYSLAPSDGDLLLMVSTGGFLVARPSASSAFRKRYVPCLLPGLSRSLRIAPFSVEPIPSVAKVDFGFLNDLIPPTISFPTVEKKLG